ncbi:MAG TPA: type II toxin-antitoxin system RelE/ParE family toxin [Patescibacteria group bacterium]|nr:type II toxin-antitoxin system RelE/ParE family toxin [Patescibacteria group bacterium]
MYKLLYHNRVAKFLKKLSPKEKKLVIEKLEFLQKDPFTQLLDIKKLTETTKNYRLRIRNMRVVFELNNKNKIIFIQNINFRGNVYN